MPASARLLLERVIDYAGTFAPASLSLADAASTYARDRRSPEGWILGRFVVPAASLRDLEGLIAPLADGEAGPPWALSVVLGADPAGRLAEIEKFNLHVPSAARIASIECPALAPADIQELRGRIPPTLEAYVETPIGADLERRIEAIAGLGARAKVRTGGVTAGAFPPPEALVRFLIACARAGVQFKATAGLHHAIRGCYALTYDPGSQTAAMHGLLNLCVAAALVSGGAPSSEAVEALVSLQADELQFGTDGLQWRDRTWRNDEVAEMRRRFRSFGSCAFREPVDELKGLGIL